MSGRLLFTLSLILAATTASSSFAQKDPTETTKTKTTKVEEPKKKTETEAEKKKREAEEKAKDRQVAVGTATGILGMGLGVLIIFGILSLVFSLLPFFIALMRGHNNSVPIFLVCFFFGWTVIGWVIALIWAFTADTPHQRRYRRD